jgi:hypothetical protein
MNQSVDLIVSMYERTYRKALVPGFFPAIEAQNLRPFANKIAVINNVEAPEDAARLAKQLVAMGEIDRFVFVSDYIDQALDKTCLTHADLGNVANYTNWALVGVCIAQSSWFVIWDSEISLAEPINWIDPSIEFLTENNRVLVASPSPDPGWLRGSIKNKTATLSGNFALSYGFSDQVFLARTDQFARPIYGEKCLASLRYPLAHLGSVFEERVDAYMRNRRLYRAIYTPAVYHHPEETIGLGYPKDMSKVEYLKLKRNQYIHRKLRNRNISRLLRWIGMEHLCV